MDITPNEGLPCDDLLESQWLDRQLPCFTDVPERRLLVAVLLDAVRCLQTGGARQRTEVLAWIRGNTAARIPFRSLCDGLEMEAAPLARLMMLPALPGGRRPRRVGVRRSSDGGKRIVVVERPKRQHSRAIPIRISA